LEEVVVEAVVCRVCWLADADDWALEAAPWRDCWLADAVDWAPEREPCRDCWLADALDPAWPDFAAAALFPEPEEPPLRCEKLPLPAVPWRE
jgi:hypothetical protein